MGKKLSDISIVPDVDTLKSAVVKTAGPLKRVAKSPDESLGELFSDVQKERVYDDGKTFADLIPR